jgi:copper resistance protein B
MTHYLKKIIPIALGSAIGLHAQAGMMEDPWVGQVRFDKLELTPEDSASQHWEIQAKLYQNLSGFIITSEGEKTPDGTDSENMLLYSKGFKPYWDWKLGIGHNTGGNGSNHAVLGIAGMAPYFFETSAYLKANVDGAILKARAERDYLLTQRLILSPEVELVAGSQSQPEYTVGQGLNSITLGLRLRYELNRKFAPYAGITWQQNFGETKSLTHTVGNTSLVVGIKFWL